MSDDLSGFSMFDLFRTEVQGQVQALNEGLLAVEKDPKHAETLEALMRAAHSIKGAARVVDVAVAVAIAHEMESCIVSAQAGAFTLGRGAVDALLKGVDLLAAIAALSYPEVAPWADAHAGEIEPLLASLRDAPRLGSRSWSNPSARPAGAPPQAAPLPIPVAPAPDAPIALPEGMAFSDRDSATEDEERPAGTSFTVTTGGARPRRAKPKERVVRLNADTVGRLTGMAGEALVQARRLQAFSRSFRIASATQAALADAVERIGGDGAAEVRRLLAEQRQHLTATADSFEDYARSSDDLTSRMYHEVLRSRMRPFGDMCHGFPRLVRDIARRLGKRVRLEIVGESIGVDRDILDKLEAPLTHIVQNAVGHGIEDPYDRLAAGKDEQGVVRIEARHWAGMLAIVVADDGRGIDTERVRTSVIKKAMVAPEIAAGLTESELYEFLFLPGFSTTDSVTDIAGRGVGLDIVQSVVHDVGGSVKVTSVPGRGMAFHLQLPITLSVLRGVLVEVGGEAYAFPLSRIDRVAVVPVDEVKSVEGRQFFELDGRNVGLVPARRVLELGGDSTAAQSLFVVVISDRVNQFGLAVDRFLGEHDLVVQPLDPRLGKIPDVSAAATTQDGEPLLILDVDDLVRSIVKLLQTGLVPRLHWDAVRPARRKRILVVEDSITVREVQRHLLANRGYEVDVAVDGMDGWNRVRQEPYDLVITDVDMPRMTGIELLTQMKQHPRLRALPVVIVSYKEREEDRFRGMHAGAAAYLTKSSFHDDTLRNIVEDLIGSASEGR
jgi:two-component system sensor histidine kinase and response regulator WspE